MGRSASRTSRPAARTSPWPSPSGAPTGSSTSSRTAAAGGTCTAWSRARGSNRWPRWRPSSPTRRGCSGGRRTAFLADGSIVAVGRRAGHDRLFHIAPGELIGEVETPFTEFEGLRSGRPGVLVLAGSPGSARVVVRLDPETLAPAGVLRRSSSMALDQAAVSLPESITFPTTGGREAHALYYAPTNPDFVGPDDERPPLVTLSHGGPTVERVDGPGPVDPVPDEPRHRGRGRGLRRQQRLRPRVPPAARRRLGRRRCRRLRGRRDLPRRARRRGPRSPGDRGRQRRRLHDPRRARVPRHVRGRHQLATASATSRSSPATPTSSSRATWTAWSGRIRRWPTGTGSDRPSTTSTRSAVRC